MLTYEQYMNSDQGGKEWIIRQVFVQLGAQQKRIEELERRLEIQIQPKNDQAEHLRRLARNSILNPQNIS